MPAVQVNDISMYYELHGTGTPVVLIGGLGADLSLLTPITRELARHRQVLVFDSGDDDPENTAPATHGAVSTSARTIGALARRTGVPVKTLREYEDLGLICTVGRSAGNYRLFGEEALWCVAVVSTLRGLGLTLSEIQELTTVYLERTDEPIGPRLAQTLQAVRARTKVRIAELQALLSRIGQYEAEHADELSGRTECPRPRSPVRPARALTLPAGGGHSLVT